ncbi:Nif11-like leader peptide family RiPP precursor [Nostoc sp. CALU 1950]|uniref:Nif11-like leader peptide family RiPP precursor n=1 Tax=Nostoc sp. CALU 1950 TaxID=3104321 RepID=UPI003EB8BABE
MSKQQVVEFFQAAAKDEILTEKVKFATSPSSMIVIAIEYGYEFTEDELLQFELERRQTQGVLEELSDQQMEAVAGGGIFGICFQTHWTHVGTLDPGRCCTWKKGG